MAGRRLLLLPRLITPYVEVEQGKRKVRKKQEVEYWKEAFCNAVAAVLVLWQLAREEKDDDGPPPP
jgi:hypothetical protein